MADLASITYVHSIQYFSKGIDSQGPYYRVEYQIEDWDDSDAFINALLGYSTYGSGGTSFTGPHRHPLSTNLICMSAEAVGRGKPTLDATNGYPAFDGGGIIRAEYRAPAIAPNGGGGVITAADDPGYFHQIDPTTPILWCTQELDFDIETLEIPSHKYKWATSGNPIDSPVQFDFCLTTMTLTFHQLPYLPMSKVRAKVGRINSSTFLGAAAETVLFRGAKTTREVSTAGTVAQKVQMVFQERPFSWNKGLLPDKLPTESGAFDYISSDGAGRRFNTTDLTPLVQL